MLGRKNYTKDELDHCKVAIERQLAAYQKLRRSVGGAKVDQRAVSAVRDFEGQFFNNLTLVLDRYFVHRIRPVAGKDGNPLNEVELISESLISNGGTFRTNKVIKYLPDESVVKLEDGDPIKLTQQDFERLSTAFFGEIEAKFL